ncbi:hypothetical protein [Streptomonospora sp. PA3]|nr:hypothetical protein [Streptomonospora sp. PA3]
MGTDTRRHAGRRPRPRNTRAKALLWTAVAGIAAADGLLDRLAI